MADNVTTQSTTPATLPSGTALGARIVTYSGDSVLIAPVGLGVFAGPDDAKTFTDINPATSDKQPAVGTAGTASSDVITVQGIAGATKIPVSPDLPTLATSATQASVSAATSSTTVLASNSSRRGFELFNDSTATLYVLFTSGTASTTTYNVQVGPGGYYSNQLYSGIVKGIWSAANGAVRVTEFS